MTSRYSIRDFGYPEGHPLHYGIPNIKSETEMQRSGSGDEAEDDDDDDYDEIVTQKLIALYSFEPENDNELRLRENQIVLISYRYGQGWLVAHDPETNETGLIPEEYVELYDDDEDEEPDSQESHVIAKEKAGRADEQHHEQDDGRPEDLKPFLPSLLQDHTVEGNESDWVDEEDDDEETAL